MARLAQLIAEIERRGGALLVRGEAGIGKSALLAAASERAAEQGVRVYRTTGVESEAHLAFAALHDLLLPFLDRLDRLPAPQRCALETAFGLARGESVPNVFLIGLATLRLVSEIATDGPSLFVVDDAQWIDRSSGIVLAFVARRLAMEPVLMWFAIRADLSSGVDDAGLPELDLQRLSKDDSSRLLEGQAPDLSADLRRRTLEQADGNPLALIELPLAADDHAVGGRSALPGSIALTARLEQAFAGRLADLDADARALILVAALEDGEPAELLQAASRIEGVSSSVQGWERIVDVGLGTLGPDRFRFRHPLIRSAIQQAIPAEERRAAHAALAAVLAEDLDRAAWHSAKATTGHDEIAAAALAAVAERARSRGGGDVAVAAFEQSAALTPNPGIRALRLCEAADLALQLGRWHESSRLFGEAQLLGLPPLKDAYVTLRLESLAGTMFSGGALIKTITEIVERSVAAGGPQKGAVLEALGGIAVRGYWEDLDDETRRKASEVARKIAVPANEPLRLCFLAQIDPIHNGREVLEQLANMSPAGIGDGVALHAVGLAGTATWADDLALPFLRAAGDRCRTEGKLAVLAEARASEAWAHLHRGAVVPALMAAAESERLAVETGLMLYAQAAKLAEALAHAQSGRSDVALALIAETEAVLLPLGATPLLAFVALTRGRAELARGHYLDAYRRLARLFDRKDVAFHPFLRGHALADLVDAALGSDGDLDLVRNYLNEWREITTETAAPYLKTQLSYAEALLSADADAEPLFQAAIASADRGWQFYAARGRLAYGSWLRRARRRAADARAPLREAAEMFAALGQETAARRALSELRASGETARRRVPEAWAELTPQELQIAQLAAQGLSNREIGERLFISARTVGTHLYHLFPKLGIASRNQLRDTPTPAGVS